MGVREMGPRIHGSMPNPKIFGRESELDALKDLLFKGEAKIIFVYGAVGVGKSSLASRLFDEAKQVFGDNRIWVNLGQLKPKPEELLKWIIEDIDSSDASNQSFNDLLTRLLQLLGEKKYFIVLDSFDSVRQLGGSVQEEYNEFIKNLVDAYDLKSTILITNRVRIPVPDKSYLHSQQIGGVSVDAARRMLPDLVGNDTDWSLFVSLCEGNCSILIHAGQYIKLHYEGNIGKFLKDTKGNIIIIEPVKRLLNDAMTNLTESEREVARVLAIEERPISFDSIWLLIKDVLNMDNLQLKEALMNLEEKCIVTKNNEKYGLYSPIRQFILREDLIKSFCNEIRNQKYNLLNSYLLLNVDDPVDIQERQRDEILKPIVQALSSEGPEVIVQRLKGIVAEFKKHRMPGYLVANVIALISELKKKPSTGAESVTLDGWDFSGMYVWNANLQDVELRNVNFSGCMFRNTIFKDTFGSISALGCTPKGDKIIVGTYNGELRIWDVGIGRQLKRKRAHEDYITSVSISPNGLHALTASIDGKVKLWKLENIETSETLKDMQKESDTNNIRGALFVDDERIVVSAGSDLFLLDLQGNTLGNTRNQKGRHTELVKALDVCPSRKLVVSGGEDGKIILWDGSTLKPLGSCDNGEMIRSLAFNPSGDIIASGDDAGNIRIWRIKIDQTQGDTKANFEKIDEKAPEGIGKVWSLAFNHDGTLLACGGNDGYIRIWNVESLKKPLSDGTPKELKGHGNWVRSLKFIPNSEPQLLVSGSEDQTIRFWDAISGTCIRVYSSISNSVYSVSYTKNGDLLAGCSDSNIYLWEPGQQDPKRVYRGHERLVWTVVANYEKFASGSDDRKVMLWKIDQQSPVSRSDEHEGLIGSLAFSHDAKHLASGDDYGNIRVWNTDVQLDQQDVETLPKLLRGRVNSLIYMPDDKELLIGSEDGKIVFWDIEHKTFKKFQELKGKVYCVDYNRERDLIAAGTGNGIIKVWERKTGKEIFSRDGIKKEVYSVRFDRSGRYLYFSDNGVDIVVCDLEKKKDNRLRGSEKSPKKIWSIAISSDGKRLAAGSAGFIEEWEFDGQSVSHIPRILRPPSPYEKMLLAGIKFFIGEQEVKNPIELDVLKELGVIVQELPPTLTPKSGFAGGIVDVQDLFKEAEKEGFKVEKEQKDLEKSNLNQIHICGILSKATRLNLGVKEIEINAIEIYCYMVDNKIDVETIKKDLERLNKHSPKCLFVFHDGETPVRLLDAIINFDAKFKKRFFCLSYDAEKDKEKILKEFGEALNSVVR